MESCGSLMDLVSGGLLHVPQPSRALRLINIPGVMSDMEFNLTEDGGEHRRSRMIVVANFLPIKAKKDPEAGWKFTFDEECLYLHLKEGFTPEISVYYVGSLGVYVDPSEEEEVAYKLLTEFRCLPTFLPPDLQKQYYHGFCKQYLWPLFHYMLPMSTDHGTRFDRSLWQAYVSANLIFSDRVMQILNPDDDFVWVHDYHLMLLPTLIRRRYYRVKLGFFLHSPFPSSEIYRTLPVRDEILRALLNSDLIGFHTFDYARHFLSCCSRLLGLDYESKRGYLGIDYFGRIVNVRILPVGIDIHRVEAAMNHPSALIKAKEVQQQFKGKKLIIGVDDMDIFKGISLKLLAFEQMLQQDPELKGNIVLVQIVNPARSMGRDVEHAKHETYEITSRINLVYGSEEYKPVVLIDQPLSFVEKIAYYVLAECCIVNAVRDGLNMIPYYYVTCRQGSPQMDEVLGVPKDSPRNSMLVVSEFVGCSPSLSGAIRVNPWNIRAVAEAIKTAISMSEGEKRLRHEKHYQYVSSHDVAYWTQSFVQDLERACVDHYNKRCWGIGFGLTFRVLALNPNFRKLSVDFLVSAYEKTNKRAIFLDYDGTLVSQSSIVKTLSEELVSILNKLCDNPDNMVFIVSGRGRKSLSEWFDPCENLGIAAEHGYFLRWSKSLDWETSGLAEDEEWRRIAMPVMEQYTETTDGSYIEAKESALVWQYRDASPDFGNCQAKELMDHLESVLANEPVAVCRGKDIIEVKPQGVSKGLVAEQVLSRMIDAGKSPDFILCIGDDRSDEDMFESILNKAVSSPPGSGRPVAPEVFACTVGQKPSKAKYYLDDTDHVMNLLRGLASVSSLKSEWIPQSQPVAFESFV